MTGTLFSVALVLVASGCSTLTSWAQPSDIDTEVQQQTEPEVVSGIQHVIWIWFENREVSQITSGVAPYFTSFAAANVNLTDFYGITHPSQPNYLHGFCGSNQNVTTNNYCTFPASTDNLAKQLAVAGKSWRVYAQNFPSPCFDGEFTTVDQFDGPGAAGRYFRKHNPAISFESVRLDPLQCVNIQPLANFDPTVNFALVVPNTINSMHDGTTTQGDAFLQAFVPLVTSSPDWGHTLLIVSFDEGTTTLNGGGHIYTAAAAPWLTHANVGTFYNHHSVLRTIEEIFGLPFLGSAATATTMTELFPSVPVTPTPTPTPTPTSTPSPTQTPTPSPTLTPTPTPTPTPSPVIAISGTTLYCSNPASDPVPSVVITLSGDATDSTVSDGSGNYTLSSVPMGGTYTVTPSKAALAPGVMNIDTVDVIAIQRHFLNLGAPLSGCPLTAADTDGIGGIDTVDIVAVQRFFLGLTTGIGNVGTYQFSPINRSYSGVVTDQTNQNYDVLIIGDVAMRFVH